MADRLDESTDRVLEALSAGASYRADSLDAPIGDGSTTKGAMIAGSDGEMGQVETRIDVESLLQGLDEVTRSITVIEEQVRCRIPARHGQRQHAHRDEQRRQTAAPGAGEPLERDGEHRRRHGHARDAAEEAEGRERSALHRFHRFFVRDAWRAVKRRLIPEGW
jgi:hypothetical protein